MSHPTDISVNKGGDMDNFLPLSSVIKMQFHKGITAAQVDEILQVSTFSTKILVGQLVHFNCTKCTKKGALPLPLCDCDHTVGRNKAIFSGSDYDHICNDRILTIKSEFGLRPYFF